MCMQNVADNLSEAEQMVHEVLMTYIGIAADMMTRSSQWKTDYKRGLTNIGLQCSDVRCMSMLGLIGTALGYTSWLEMCASVVVLLLYFGLRPDERVPHSDLTAIVTDAPDMPGNVHGPSYGGLKAGNASSA